jgi:twitching motility protein PilJ
MPHRCSSQFRVWRFAVSAYRRRGRARGPAPSSAADDGDAPLRLRDALGRRRNASAPVDTGPGFKLPLIGHLPAQRQLSVLSTALAVSLA